MHLIHACQAPSYLTDMVTPTAAVNARARLWLAAVCSTRNQDETPIRNRAFSYASPAAWNTLPLHLQQMTNTDTFKRHLKGHLFSSQLAFLDSPIYFYTVLYVYFYVFRSTPKSQPKNMGLRCPSVRPSTKSFSDSDEIMYVGRGRWVMHDGMPYDPIQGQGHETFKVRNSSIFKIYLLRHF